MKIRTEGELFNKLDEDLSWRKSDLARLSALIVKNEKTLVGQTLLRAAIPIIYAHWEGFIKEASVAYLNFVSIKGLKYSEHSKGVLALHLKYKFFSKSTPYTDLEKAQQLCDFIARELDSRSNIKAIPEPIKTRANLNSEVLKEISSILDIDYSHFLPHETIIDAQLLSARNGIAHGEYREIDFTLYTQLHHLILTLLELFKTEIENRVVQKKYKK